MMRSVEAQSQIRSVPAERVMESLSYAASSTQAICEGQLLDLQSTHRYQISEHLALISELKAGLAIETLMMIPAILAGENDIEKGYIKQFAKHLGLAFQIKDDLLDHSGQTECLGKPTGLESKNQKASLSPV